MFITDKLRYNNLIYWWLRDINTSKRKIYDIKIKTLAFIIYLDSELEMTFIIDFKQQFSNSSWYMSLKKGSITEE